MGASDGPSSTRVVVVDDQLAFAEAVALAINTQDDLECVGLAGNIADALAMIEQHQPSVVLLDVHLPDGDGIEAVSRVKQRRPEANVVLLTADEHTATVARAAESGAAGFLQKTSPISAILTAIRTASEGGMLVDPVTLSAIIQTLSATKSERPSRLSRRGLTQREEEVLNLMGRGMDPATIAKSLKITISTARSHIKSILAKLGVHSQLEAVITALREELIER